MKQTLTFISLIALVALASCEKDFVDDRDCNMVQPPEGGAIGGWDDQVNDSIVPKDTIVGGFDISLDEWDDSIHHSIEI